MTAQYKIIIPVLKTLILSVLLFGCSSDPDETFTGFGESYHPFERTADHGAYMKGHSFPFATCKECHGTDLHGVPGTPAGDMVRSCYACHGAPAGRSRCNVCHGNALADSSDTLAWAPPLDINGRDTTSAIGVGAHQAHLRADDGQFARVNCEACHNIPQAEAVFNHIIDTLAGGEVIFSGVAVANNAQPIYNRENTSCSATYCHNSATPVWTEVNGTWNACGSCHAIPPQTEDHSDWVILDYCYLCHGSVIDRHGNIIAPGLHVNGRIDRTTRTMAGLGTPNAIRSLNH
jgi:predicted CxxxxCH...CXXCH cytochrome family protein